MSHSLWSRGWGTSPGPPHHPTAKPLVLEILALCPPRCARGEAELCAVLPLILHPSQGEGCAWSRRMEHGPDVTLEDAARGGGAAAPPVVPFGVLSRSAFRSRRGLEAGELSPRGILGCQSFPSCSQHLLASRTQILVTKPSVLFLGMELTTGASYSATGRAAPPFWGRICWNPSTCPWCPPRGAQPLMYPSSSQAASWCRGPSGGDGAVTGPMLQSHLCPPGGGTRSG